MGKQWESSAPYYLLALPSLITTLCRSTHSKTTGQSSRSIASVGSKTTLDHLSSVTFRTDAFLELGDDCYIFQTWFESCFGLEDVRKYSEIWRPRLHRNYRDSWSGHSDCTDKPGSRVSRVVSILLHFFADDQLSSKNLYTTVLANELVRVFQLCDKDDRVRVVILTAAPTAPAFCSGVSSMSF